MSVASHADLYRERYEKALEETIMDERPSIVPQYRNGEPTYAAMWGHRKCKCGGLLTQQPVAPTEKIRASFICSQCTQVTYLRSHE